MFNDWTETVIMIIWILIGDLWFCVVGYHFGSRSTREYQEVIKVLQEKPELIDLIIAKGQELKGNDE